MYPNRQQSGKHTIVLPGDHKLYPKSGKRGQQCRMGFTYVTPQKRKFSVKNSSVSVNNSAENCGIAHIY